MSNQVKNLFLSTAIVAMFLSPIGDAAGNSHDGGHHKAKKGHHEMKKSDHGKMNDHKLPKDVGVPGKPSEVTRTIEVNITDNEYEPKKIMVKTGETIRFVIKNAGEFVHEFNIGTKNMHAAHQEEMMMMVDHGVLEPDKINRDKMKMKMADGRTMEHNDPNSVLLEPGKTGEIVWKFTNAGGIEFACNVPGHYDLGMVGVLTIHH